MIIGAGASYELGLPIGEQLTQEIAGLLAYRRDDFGRFSNGSPNIEDALRVLKRDGQISDVGRYLAMARVVSDGMFFARSIDNFLEAHAGAEGVDECGKLAIVEAILRAEGRSAIFAKRGDVPSLSSIRKANSWHTEFVKFLTENVHLDSIESLFDNLTFVIFNYDRCVEHFLFHAIRVYYNLPDKRVGEVLQRAKFIHPYGAIGPLPWQGSPGGGIAFGEDPDHHALVKAFRNIRTYSEQIEDDDALSAIRDAILLARQVVFLGFGYIDQNMKLLTMPADNLEAVYGTALNFSRSDVDAIDEAIEAAFKSDERDGMLDVKLADITCLELFKQYSKSISR